MTQRIVIAGASGFIGDFIAQAFRAEGAEVSMIGRIGPDARWGETGKMTTLLDGADVLINLAGKSVNCRWTTANRAEILRSRVETTAELAEAIRACHVPPPLWINASTATIYRDAHDRPMTESTGEVGTGFSVSVGTAWERAFFEPTLPRTRRVALRIAIVLGDGGALTPLITLTRFGLGGPQLDGRWIGSAARRAAGTLHQFRVPGGRQRLSWIHLDDVLGIIRFIRDNPHIDGPVIVSSPDATDNRTFMRMLRRVLGVPFGLPAFRWMLELGTAALRAESELVLKSRWVAPERLLKEGYVFRWPDLEPALREIVTSRESRPT